MILLLRAFQSRNRSLIFRDPTLRAYATLAFDLQTRLRNSTRLLNLHLATHPAAPASRLRVPTFVHEQWLPWYLALAAFVRTWLFIGAELSSDRRSGCACANTERRRAFSLLRAFAPTQLQNHLSDSKAHNSLLPLRGIRLLSLS